METIQRIKTIDPRNIVKPDNLVVHVTDNRAAAGVWAYGRNIHFVRFEDFKWNYDNEDAVIHTALRSVTLDANCLDLNVGNDPHILWNDGFGLYYMHQEKKVWTTPSLIYSGSVGSFALRCLRYYPFTVFIGYTKKQASAVDRLVLTDSSGLTSLEVPLIGDTNKLLQLKFAGSTKLYLLWTEMESEANENSSFSSISDSSTSSGESSLSSSSFSSTSGFSSTLSSSTGSHSFSSSTEAEVESKIKYLRYNLLTRTLDFFPPYIVDFTQTHGNILSFDFGSLS